MNGIKFKGYKAFSDDWISIENFPNITVLIGRNNSGKSSCIDVIESLTNPIVYKQCQELGLDVIMEHNLTEEEVKSVFPESTYGGGIPANNFWEFGKNFIGERVAFDVGVQSRYIGEGVEFLYNWCSNEEIFQKKYERYWKLFESRQVNDWEGYCVRRLSAERNILPEVEEDSEYLESTGVGASNLIRKILNYSGYDENLIEKELLGALNYIIYPESQYSGIKVQQIRKDDGIYWEIYLIENERRFPLSRMGSGLKTIILVLLNLLIIPQFEKGDKDKIIYAFEELENNLHPALQRRLFDYLYQYSCKHDSVKLDVYYRMCDQVAEIAKRSSELMKTDASRFENGWGIDPQTFARDKEKHILVSDLIYCCLTYDLFGGITFKRKKVKEKQLIQEKKEKANRLEKELEDVQEEFQKLQEAMEYFDSIFEVGTNIRHKRYGLGTITARSDNIIEVAFIKGEKKKFGMIVSIINSIIRPQGVDCTEQMKKNIDILKRKTAIKSAVSYAEKNLSEYTEYLD